MFVGGLSWDTAKDLKDYFTKFERSLTVNKMDPNTDGQKRFWVYPVKMQPV